MTRKTRLTRKKTCFMCDPKIDGNMHVFDPSKHHVCLLCGAKLRRLAFDHDGEASFTMGRDEVTITAVREVHPETILALLKSCVPLGTGAWWTEESLLAYCAEMRDVWEHPLWAHVTDRQITVALFALLDEGKITVDKTGAIKGVEPKAHPASLLVDVIRRQRSRLMEWLHHDMGGKATQRQLVRAFEEDMGSEELEHVVNWALDCKLMKVNSRHNFKITLQGVGYVEGEDA